MTTIAITETEIAADGLRLFTDLIAGTKHQKIVVTDDAVYAFTGSVPAMAPMIEWHKAGADPDKLPPNLGNEWGTLIVINQADGIHKYTHSCLYKEWFAPPIAFGAGADYALGAIWHGASAREAIELICEHTNHTGGEVMSVDIRRFLTPFKEAAE
jgi:hypothetical protein